MNWFDSLCTSLGRWLLGTCRNPECYNVAHDHFDGLCFFCWDQRERDRDKLSAEKRNTHREAGGVSGASIRKEKVKCAPVAPGHVGGNRANPRTLALHEDARRSFGGCRDRAPRVPAAMHRTARAVQAACIAMVEFITTPFSARLRTLSPQPLALSLFFALAGFGSPVFGSPSPAGGPAAAASFLAELSPSEIGTSANAGVYWLMAAIAILQVIAFFRPAPALHKQFADRDDHEKDITEIKDALRAITDKFEHWNTSQYDARRRMHKKINHMTSALSYFAGTLEKSDPVSAQRMRTIIDRVDAEGDES